MQFDFAAVGRGGFGGWERERVADHPLLASRRRAKTAVREHLVVAHSGSHDFRNPAAHFGNEIDGIDRKNQTKHQNGEK